MAYYRSNRGITDWEAFLRDQHSTPQNFQSSYHPVRSTTSSYSTHLKPAVTTMASDNAGRNMSATGSYIHGDSAALGTYDFRTVSSAPNLKPSTVFVHTEKGRSVSPYSSSTLTVNKDQGQAESPYTSYTYGTPEKERAGSSASDMTVEEEDPRTEMRKTYDLVKELQKINLDKYDLQYRQMMEQVDPGTLSKEVTFAQQKEASDTKAVSRTERRLRKERDELKKEIRELRFKLEEEEKLRNETQSKYTAEAKKEIDDLRMKLQEEEGKILQRRTQFEEQILEFQEKEKKWSEDQEKLLFNIKTLKETVRKSERERSVAEREKTEALTRLSKEMGTKLNNKNPNIADLSDANRPTKLAEKYNELYDNEWTDALEVLENMGEETACKVLLQIMETCYQFCQETAAEQMQNLEHFLAMPVAKTTAARDTTTLDVSTAVSKLLKECQKEMKMDNPEIFYREYKSWRMSSIHSHKVGDYTKKCLEICWLMVIQDPPVVLGKPAEVGSAFDSNSYKEYTRTGSVVSFTVWLPLFLHDGGPLLCKGTAQPIQMQKERAKTAIERSTRQRDYTSGEYSGGRPTTSAEATTYTDTRRNKPIETNIDNFFTEGSRTKQDEQGQRHTSAHKRSDVYSDVHVPRTSESRVPQRVIAGYPAEKYRQYYGTGPRFMHGERGGVYVYYDGKLYTQKDWEDLNAMFETGQSEA